MATFENDLDAVELRIRLEEAEETLRAIRSGEVDALVVEGVDGNRVFTLQGADHPYRVLIEAMQQGAISLGTDGTVLFCNRCFADMVKKDPSQVIGGTVLDFFPASQHPGIRLYLGESRVPSGQAEVHLQAMDGSIVPVNLAFAPMTLMNAETICVIVTDQTGERERQELEAAVRLKEEALGLLKVNEQRLRSLVDNSPDLIARLDLNLRFIFVNPAVERFLGATSADLIGQSALDTARTGNDSTEFLEKCRDARQDRLPKTFDFTNERSGNRKHFTSKIVPEPGPDGNIESFLILTTDITGRVQAVTERRLAEEVLRDADRRKDEFLATLAHELRNPLAPIRNGLQLLGLASDQADVVEQTRAMLERQIRQMVRLIDDLMDVSRISRGKLELRKERVQLAEAINNAIETSRPLIDEMGHELTVVLPTQPVTVEADLTRLAQVFMNLLNNAAKYSERGGHIRLICKQEGGEVLVSVSDTGIGITPDQLPRIFGMFTQVDRSLEKAQGGLGIGLSLAERLVEMHGGRIEAKSEGAGKGAEFIVHLPFVIDDSKSTGSVDDEMRPLRSSFRILIVDDNRDGADSLSMMLRAVGHEIRTAYDGQQGIDAAEQWQPDVILLDIGLPKINGYDICRRIRQVDWGKRAAVIALTGWGQHEDRRRSHEAGFDHHMVKPVDPRALLKLLAGLQIVKSEYSATT